MVFEAQANAVVDICFCLVRSLKPIIVFLPHTCQVIIQAVIWSWLDYCKVCS